MVEEIYKRIEYINEEIERLTIEYNKEKAKLVNHINEDILNIAHNLIEKLVVIDQKIYDYQFEKKNLYKLLELK